MSKLCPKKDPLAWWLNKGWKKFDQNKPPTVDFVVVYSSEVLRPGRRSTQEHEIWLRTFNPMPPSAFARIGRREFRIVLIKDYIPNE